MSKDSQRSLPPAVQLPPPPPPSIIMLQIVEGFESAAREKGIRARALEVKLCCI